MRTIYVCGNALEPRDRLPLLLMPYLKKRFPNISFIHFDPTEELSLKKTKDITLIDSIVGVDTVQIFHSLSNFQQSPQNSVHDFDLFLSLRLLIKLGKLQKITIIGVPANGKKIAIQQEVARILMTNEI